MKPTNENNLSKFNELLVRVPLFLQEKAFAFSEVRPLLLDAEDLEDFESDYVEQIVANCAKVLRTIEVKAVKLGY
jgi:CRISPR/Cas system CSM-associated protein Csm5 (group 7 of RAMP superfamily)